MIFFYVAEAASYTGKGKCSDKLRPKSSQIAKSAPVSSPSGGTNSISSVETSITVLSEITSGPIIEPTGEIRAAILPSHSTNVQHQQTVASSSSATGTPHQPVAGPSRMLGSNVARKVHTTRGIPTLKRKAQDATKSKYEMHRKRPFLQSWTDEFPWLYKDDEADRMFCGWCVTNGTPHQLADRKSPLVLGSGGEGRYKKDGLVTHDKSNVHRKIEALRSREKAKGPMDTVIQKMSQGNTEIVKHHFNTAYHIARHKMAFRQYQPLCELQEKNGVDMGDYYKNDKACKDFIENISEAEKERVKDEVGKVQWISVLADGSTDHTITEQEIVYVRYVTSEGVLKTELADIVAAKSADASGVFNAIEDGLHNIDVPLTKVVCTNMDGASVNQGKFHGVARKIADALPHTVTNIWCVAHKLELAMLDAIKTSSNVTSTVEECVDFVYRFYYRSSKRRRSLKGIAEILEEDIAYFSAPQGTRWMASRLRAYSALKQNLGAVRLHMEDAASGKGEDAAKCKGYLKKLRSLQFTQALHFTIDVLTILSDISCTFQKDELLITDIAVKFGEGIIKLKVLKELTGKAFSEYTASAETQPSDTQKAALLSFVDQVVTFLQKRFDFLNEEPFTSFQIFDYRDHPSSLDEDFPAHGNDKISSLCQHFADILGNDCMQKIVEEWPEMKLLLTKKKRRAPFETFCSLMADTPDSLQNIMILVRLMFTMSPSTAACERGFSAMNTIKNIRRIRMGDDTLSTLMRINSMHQTVKEFDATPAIKKWLGSSKNPRMIVHR